MSTSRCSRAPQHVRRSVRPRHSTSTQSAAARIREFRPDARIIALLRSPVDRAYSYYCMLRRLGAEPLSFEDAIGKEPGRSPVLHHVQQGLYMPQLRRYLDQFGDESVAVFFTDDLRDDASGICRRVLSLLDVDTEADIDTSTIHNPASVPRSFALSRLWRWVSTGDRSHKRVTRHVVPSAMRRATRSAVRRTLFTRHIPPMRPETREQLVERYREDVSELEVLTGKDLSHWLR